MKKNSTNVNWKEIDDVIFVPKKHNRNPIYSFLVFILSVVGFYFSLNEYTSNMKYHYILSYGEGREYLIAIIWITGIMATITLIDFVILLTRSFSGNNQR